MRPRSTSNVEHTAPEIDLTPTNHPVDPAAPSRRDGILPTRQFVASTGVTVPSRPGTAPQGLAAKHQPSLRPPTCIVHVALCTDICTDRNGPGTASHSIGRKSPTSPALPCSDPARRPSGPSEIAQRSTASSKPSTWTPREHQTAASSYYPAIPIHRACSLRPKRTARFIRASLRSAYIAPTCYAYMYPNGWENLPLKPSHTQVYPRTYPSACIHTHICENTMYVYRYAA